MGVYSEMYVHQVTHTHTHTRTHIHTCQCIAARLFIEHKTYRGVLTDGTDGRGPDAVFPAIFAALSCARANRRRVRRFGRLCRGCGRLTTILESLYLCSERISRQPQHGDEEIREQQTSFLWLPTLENERKSSQDGRSWRRSPIVFVCLACSSLSTCFRLVAQSPTV
jgi:hypothetical protein